jgi:hypothetical protein
MIDEHPPAAMAQQVKRTNEKLFLSFMTIRADAKNWKCECK